MELSVSNFNSLLFYTELSIEFLNQMDVEERKS